MSDLNAAPAADAAPGPIDYQPPADTQEALSLDAAFSQWTEPKKPEEESAEPPAATPQQESEAQAEDSDQPQADPAEQPKADEPEAELPPIEPPRSWTKEEKEAFAKWPREAQESISRVASTREAEFRRSQNEVAEARKAAEAERKAITDEREKYLKNLSSQDEALEAELTQKFPNIKTMDDVNFLANEALRLAQSGNPDDLTQSHQINAYLTAWNTLQQKIAHVKSERAATEQRSSQDRMNEWAKFTKAESDAFENDVPEFKAKKDDYTRKAAEILSELGFSSEELNELASGKAKIALFDRRMQRLLFDRIRLSEIQAAVPKAAPKTLPPVQRPGAKQPASAAQAQSLQALNQKLNATGSVDDALALLMAQRKAS